MSENTTDIVDEFSDRVKNELEDAVLTILEKYVEKYPNLNGIVLSTLLKNLDALKVTLETKSEFAKYDQSDFHLLD